MIDLTGLYLRELIPLGSITLNVYGALYVLAFLLLVYMIKKEAHNTTLDSERCALYLILGILLGARLTYMLVYAFPQFIQNPLNVFLIGKGGMSFHGGIIGFLIGGYWFLTKNKEHTHVLMRIAEKICYTLPGILIIGRLINLTNGEIPGKLTTLPWCIVQRTIEGCRHPIPLYEILGMCVLILFFMHIKHKISSVEKKGALCIILYSILRLLVDIFREQTTYGGIGISLILSSITLLLGVIIYRTKRA